MEPGLVHLGKVAKPHGIRGEVKIYALSGRPENFSAYRQLILVDQDKVRHQYTVTTCRVQGTFAVLALAGVAGRTEAEGLVGCDVWVAEADLAPLAADEFYWHEIMGAQVVEQDGHLLGTLMSLLDTGGTELMVVVGRDREELLIPGRGEFIVEIGPERIVVDLPPGLLDINRTR